MLPRDLTVRQLPPRLSISVLTLYEDVTGELIRQNIVEDQAGVPLYMDIQLIDTNTCDPLPNIYTDLWHCNATVCHSSIHDLSRLDLTILK